MKYKLNLIVAFCMVSLQLSAGDRLDNPYVFGNVRLTVITDGLLRAEYALDGKFSDDRTMFAWNRNELCRDCEIEQVDSITYIITTPKMKVKYIADNYPFGIFNLNIEFDNAGKKSVWNTRKSAFPSKNNLSGAVSTLDQVDGRCTLDEGILSRDGYYMIDDTGKERIVDGWIAEPSKNHVQDYYVFIYGDDYKSALKSLGAISGYAPMNRKYMHGSWYCRFHNYTADDYMQIVREYHENDYPLDVMAIDMDWHTMDAKVGSGHGGRLSWTGYTWNNAMFPEPEIFIGNLKSERLAVTLNDHPADGMRPHEKYWNEFMRALGRNPDKDRVPLFDAADKNYMESFFKYALEPNERAGVDFWWLDWQQNYIRPYMNGTKMRHLPWLNYLYFNHSETKDIRGAVYSRWGGFGSQRYPIQFSGDIFSTWESLAFEVEMTATSGNAGCFFWAHDVGGHIGGEDPELFTRWAQFGALSSTMRVHSSSDSRDRRPWLWGEQATDAMRKAWHLRAELFPYIYSSLRQTHEEMLPLVRAMYIDYPEMEDAYSSPRQYMFGDNILVSPIVSSGKGKNHVAETDVWFPEGSEWYSFVDGKKYNGGQRTKIKTAIDEIPIFVKGGAAIPMQPYTERMATSPLNELRVRVYPAVMGSDITTILYEDDGLSKDYEQGGYSKTGLHCTYDGNVLIVSVEPSVGSYGGQPLKRNVVFELAGLSSKASFHLPDNAVVFRDSIFTSIRIDGTDIRNECMISINDPYRK